MYSLVDLVHQNPCAFSFLENIGDTTRGTPEDEDQQGEVFSSKMSGLNFSGTQVTYHLELRSSLELGQINFRTCDLVDEILVSSIFGKDVLKAFCCGWLKMTFQHLLSSFVL